MEDQAILITQYNLVILNTIFYLIVMVLVLAIQVILNQLIRTFYGWNYNSIC